jgi:hypothetical protein
MRLKASSKLTLFPKKVVSKLFNGENLFKKWVAIPLATILHLESNVDYFELWKISSLKT